MNDAEVPGGGPVAEVSAVGRIPGVFFSPGRTFESIGRRPTWLIPLLLWMAVSLAFTAVLLPKIDYERMIRARLERGGQPVPEERVQSIVAQQKKFAPVLYNAIAVVSPAIVSLVVGLVFWGSFKAFGWDMSFRQSFGVTTHAFLPSVLGSLLFLPVLMRQETVDPQTMQDLFLSNLGFLVDRHTSPAVHSILQSIDLFSIWNVVLFVIGYAAAAKVSRKKAASVVVTLWAIYVLGKAGFAALFA